jgi:hypothetical protein
MPRPTHPQRGAAPAAGRAAAAAQVLLAALALGACGVSLDLGYGTSFDDSPPSVGIVAAQTSVRAGQHVRVVAAAADENGIDSVAFYRIDDTGPVLLGKDGFEPYEWQVTAPADGRATLRVFARATDNEGNRADSEAVSITVTP